MSKPAALVLIKSLRSEQTELLAADKELHAITVSASSDVWGSVTQTGNTFTIKAWDEDVLSLLVIAWEEGRILILILRLRLKFCGGKKEVYSFTVYTLYLLFDIVTHYNIYSLKIGKQRNDQTTTDYSLHPVSPHKWSQHLNNKIN